MLRNKVAIVTGSSRGIGAATARLLASQGAKVAVNYFSSREHGEKTEASSDSADLLRQRLGTVAGDQAGPDGVAIHAPEYPRGEDGVGDRQANAPEQQPS